MEDVRYYIPTRGRVDDQRTLSQIPVSRHRQVTIVCPEHEASAHEANWPGVEVLAQPDHIVTIGQKREWIYNVALGNLVMFAWQLDDDLKFKVFVDGKHRTSSKFPEATERAWYHLDLLQKQYSAVGVGTSFFAPPGGVKENYHLGFMFGFSMTAYEQLKTNRMDAFEDIDYTLQMLRAGVRIAVSYELVVDQVKADAPGGVSGQRDHASIMSALATLMEEHPGLVVEKPLRPGAHPASIVRVSWAKAAKEGGM